MKKALGITLIITGIGVGLYIGVWVLFIGGIIQGIEGIKADPINSTDIAIGIAKALFANIVGFISALIMIVPGLGLLAGKTN